MAVYDHVLTPDRIHAHYEAAGQPLTPRITTFTLSGAGFVSPVGLALPEGGGTVGLTWEVEGAETIRLSGPLPEPPGGASGFSEVEVTIDSTFTLTATNAEGTVSASLKAHIAPMVLAPRLSEFMANNDGFLRDGYGEESDWIEIHNPNPFPLDLAGHQLRDRANHWIFPAGSPIPAQGYLLVFASGKDARDPAGHWHTNFALANSGEYLALLSPDASVLAEFAPAFPPQFSDVSYGLAGDPAQLVYFTKPTPGAENGPGFASLLEYEGRLSFAFGRGFYSAPFEERITSTIPGASLIYTTDGSLPTPGHGTRIDPPDTNATVSAVIPIDGTTNAGVTCLRVIQVKEGSAPSRAVTQTYLFPSGVVFQSNASTVAAGWPSSPVNGQVFDYGMNRQRIAPGGGAYSREEIARSLEALPTLSLVTDLENLVDPASGIYVNAQNRGRAWERPVSVELIHPEGFADPDGHTEGFQIEAGLRIRGGFSRRPEFFKHAFRLFFRRAYGAGKLRFPLFGREGAEEFDKIDLRSSSNFDWAREANFALGRQFTFARDVFSRDTQGALGQPHTKSRYYHLYLNGTYWGIYQTQERAEAAFGASYFGGDRDDFDCVKSSNHIDYMITIFWTGDGDAVLSNFLANNRANNWFGIRNRSGEEGFRFFAHDAEHTLGASTSREDRTGPFSGSNQGNFLYANPQWMHQDLMANPEYRLRFADRVQKHFSRDGALTEPATLTRFNRRTSQVRPALKAYAARWADARYPPSYHLGLWEDEIARITARWIPGRTETVLDQLRADGLYPGLAAPLLVNGNGTASPDGEVPAGSTISLVPPPSENEGIIYYTLDGRDPRAPATPLPTIIKVLVDFDDLRAFHLPTTGHDGFEGSHQLSAEPLAYYSFDGDATDGAPGNGRQDGLLLNGATISSEARVGTGALALDGLNDYVSLGDPPELRISGPISMAAWVRAQAQPTRLLGNILAKGYHLNPNRELFLRFAGQLDSWRVGSWDGNIHGTAIENASADLGQWIHLAGTYDGTHWNLYRNGLLVSSTAADTGAVAVSDDWAIGARSTGTERFFNGLIDEVFLFDTALSPADVQLLHEGSAPAWQRPDFPEAAQWPRAAGGLGYDDSDRLTPLIQNDLGDEWKTNASSLLTRSEFTIPPGGLADLDPLELNLFYDAGFVAYLNGREILRVNAPVSLKASSRATASHASADEMVTFDLSRHLPLLQEGSNLLAIHSLNDAPDSPDLLIRCRLRVGQKPRLLTSSAREFLAPIPITGPTTISTRHFRDGEWSALITATFHNGLVQPSPQNLVVSQIHYHPVTIPGDSFEAKDYEFIELMNIGSESLDLGALRLRGDIRFDFSPGTSLAPAARVQLARHRSAFAQRYGTQGPGLLGEFSGSLSNGGGRLLLSDEIAGVVRDFSFHDAPPWPEAADGTGHGLVLIHPETNPDHAAPANWRISATIHATPGESDSLRFSGDPSLDRDRDGLTALLEYALGSDDASFTRDLWSFPGAGPGNGISSVLINRRLNADDIRWFPEVSFDLENWTLLSPRHRSLTDIPGLVTEHYHLETRNHSTPRFFRIRVEQR